MSKIAIILSVLFSYMQIAPFVLKMDKGSGVILNLNGEDESTKKTKGKNEKTTGFDSDLELIQNYFLSLYNPDVKIYRRSGVPQVPYLGYKEPPPDFI